MTASIGRALALALLLVGPIGVGRAAEPTPLGISYVVGNSIYWDVDTAIDEGFFHDEGFAPEPTTFQSSPQAVQLLISGGADLVTVEPEALMAAVLRGGTDLGAIAQAQQTPDWLLVGRPEVKDWSDLKDKTIGFSALRVLEFFLTQRLLASHGLGKDDWNAIQVGTSPAKLAALEKGSIAASVLFDPLAFKAITDQGGLHSLAKYTDLGKYPPTVFVVKRSWAGQADNGMRLARVLVRAHAWLYDPAHHDAALTIVEKYTKCDAATAQRVYEQYFLTDKLYTPDAAIDLDGLGRETALLAENGEVPKDKTLDPRQFILAKEQGGMSH